MPEYPTFNWETREGKKIISTEELVETLKNTHPENPDTQQLALSWQESKEAEFENIKDANERMGAQIGLEVERAEVYLSAGFGQESWDAFQHAVQMATYGKRPDLAEKIQARIEEIDNS